MITTRVVARTSFTLGNVTLRISLRTSLKKPRVRAGNCFTRPPRLLSSSRAIAAFAIQILLSLIQPLRNGPSRRAGLAASTASEKTGRGGGKEGGKSGIQPPLTFHVLVLSYDTLLLNN